MHPRRRVYIQVWLSAIGFSILPGCLEYNRHQPIDETQTLSHVIQLTDNLSRAGQVVLTRDQRWILFLAGDQSKIPQPVQLYLAMLKWNDKELTGIERPICITPPGSHNALGSFSPDGTTIVFSSTALARVQPTTAESNSLALHIFRFDDWEGALSMTDADRGIDLAKHAVVPNRFNLGGCCYSPDGKWICFASAHGADSSLFVMHPDGTHIVRITQTNSKDGGASFSPDGRRLLYRSERNENHTTQIFLADLTFDAIGEITGMSAEHQLTDDDNNNTCPAWHPDGNHIIYSTSRHGRDNYELYLMNDSGRKKTRITFSPGADLFPVFSPDGRYLLWASRRSRDGTIQLFAGQFDFPRGS